MFGLNSPPRVQESDGRLVTPGASLSPPQSPAPPRTPKRPEHKKTSPTKKGDTLRPWVHRRLQTFSRTLYQLPLAYLARGDSRVGIPFSLSYTSDAQVDVATQTADTSPQLPPAVPSRHRVNKPATQKERPALEKSPRRPFLNSAARRRLRRSQMAHAAYYV